MHCNVHFVCETFDSDSVIVIHLFTGIPSGVVAMSGTAVSHGAIDEKPVNSAHEIAENQGCPTTSTLTMIKCLQNTPAANIIKVSWNYKGCVNVLIPFLLLNTVLILSSNNNLCL